jgi:hypothetical protein
MLDRERSVARASEEARMLRLLGHNRRRIADIMGPSYISKAGSDFLGASESASASRTKPPILLSDSSILLLLRYLEIPVHYLSPAFERIGYWTLELQVVDFPANSTQSSFGFKILPV